MLLLRRASEAKRANKMAARAGVLPALDPAWPTIPSGGGLGAVLLHAAPLRRSSTTRRRRAVRLAEGFATAVSLDHRRRCARNARSLEPASWAVTAASPFGVFEPHHSVFEATLDRRLASRADESPHTGLLTAPCDATGRVTHWRENRSKYRCA